MVYLMGVDLGTTSIKSVIFDERGNRKASASSEYPQLVDSSKRTVELNMIDLWNAFRTSIQESLRSFRCRPSEIISLAVSGQGDTFIALDKNKRPLGNAITYLDNRSYQQSKFMEKEFGIERIFRITGQPCVSPSYPATKILWIRENKPELFQKVAMYAPIEDYLVYRVTGAMFCEHSGASMTLMFDIQKKQWWNEILQFLKIHEHQLPELRPPGSLIGEVTGRASRKTGLHQGTLVSTGAHDHAAAAVGAGNIRPGIIGESTGAVLGITATLDTPFYDEKRLILCNCHAVQDKYILLLVCKTGGMALRWFRDELCQSEINEARRRRVDPYDVLSKMASKTPPGAGGLIFLPHLMGAGTPENDPNARGVFFGLTLGHTKGHMVRAIMESVGFMVRRNLDVLDRSGIRTKEIRSIGGGARSGLWNQIKADVTQKRVVTLRTEEAASLGVAILAGVSSQVFTSVEQACDRMVRSAKVYLPNPEKKWIYNEQFCMYVDLYEHLKDLFQKQIVAQGIQPS